MKSKAEFKKQWLEANRRIEAAEVGAEFAREYRNGLLLEAWAEGDGLLYREIAEVMGVTVGYVAQLITRAKQSA